MSNSGLVKVPIVDKNGVVTSRLKNLDKGTSNPMRAGALTTVGAIGGTGLYEPEVIVPEPGKQARLRDGETYLEHTSFEYEDMPWDLAPEGYSGAYCGDCGSFFTDDDVDTASESSPLTCSACGEVSDQGVLPSAVRYNDRRLFSKSAVRKDTWYHITVRKNWVGDITEEQDVDYQPFVHLGSKEAALTRMKALVEDEVYAGKNGETQYYCYEVRIKPQAPIADAVLPDDNEIAPAMPVEMNYNYTGDGYEAYGVSRYVNEFESHGSISLLAHPSSFEVIESYPVDKNYNEQFTSRIAA